MRMRPLIGSETEERAGDQLGELGSAHGHWVATRNGAAHAWGSSGQRESPAVCRGRSAGFGNQVVHCESAIRIQRIRQRGGSLPSVGLSQLAYIRGGKGVQHAGRFSPSNSQHAARGEEGGKKAQKEGRKSAKNNENEKKKWFEKKRIA